MAEGTRFYAVLALSVMLVGTAVVVSVIQWRSDTATDELGVPVASIAGDSPAPDPDTRATGAQVEGAPDSYSALQQVLSIAPSTEQFVPSVEPSGAVETASTVVGPAPTPEDTEALKQAIIGGDLQTLTDAFAAGATVQALEATGISSLILALENRSFVLLPTLVHNGADLHARDQGQETPLMWAVRVGEIAEVGELLGHRAEIDAADASGQTALFEAVDRGHVEVVRHLLLWRTDVNYRDSDGLTPLDHANRGTNQQLVEILRAAGGVTNMPPPIP